jgi:hypothetical protein
MQIRLEVIKSIILGDDPFWPTLIPFISKTTGARSDMVEKWWQEIS